jgi:hypothetical protein
MKKIILLGLCAGLLAITSCAPSSSSGDGAMSSQGQGGRPSFEALDTDANDSVSFEEFSASLAARGSGGTDPSQVFGMIDTDGSGELSRDEVANAPQRP